MGESGGCLPGAPPVVDAHLTQLWGNFAIGFPAGAKLLDLACGTGAVSRSLLRANRELSLVGVDYADLPKGKSKKIKLVGGTDIKVIHGPASGDTNCISNRPEQVRVLGRLHQDPGDIQSIPNHL